VNVSGFVWNWGKIVDHDMVLTRIGSPIESFDIAVSKCNPVFDLNCRGTKTLSFHRSSFRMVDGVRQQVNTNTAFSMVQWLKARISSASRR
jgi:hypothetical protein